MTQGRTVIEWFQVLQTCEDLAVGKMLLGDMMGYEGKPYRSDLESVINLLTAVRMQQLSKTPTKNVLWQSPGGERDYD